MTLIQFNQIKPLNKARGCKRESLAIITVESEKEIIQTNSRQSQEGGTRKKIFAQGIKARFCILCSATACFTYGAALLTPSPIRLASVCDFGPISGSGIAMKAVLLKKHSICLFNVYVKRNYIVIIKCSESLAECKSHDKRVKTVSSVFLIYLVPKLPVDLKSKISLTN